MEATKKCRVCGRTLPLSEFGKHNKTRDGLTRRCNDCIANRRRKPRIPAQVVFDIKACADEALCDELRRRGFTGEIIYRKVISI